MSFWRRADLAIGCGLLIRASPRFPSGRTVWQDLTSLCEAARPRSAPALREFLGEPDAGQAFASAGRRLRAGGLPYRTSRSQERRRARMRVFQFDFYRDRARLRPDDI